MQEAASDLAADQLWLERLALAAVYDRHLAISVASGSLLGLLLRRASLLARSGSSAAHEVRRRVPVGMSQAAFTQVFLLHFASSAMPHPPTSPLQAEELIAHLNQVVCVLAELAGEAVDSAAADGMPDSLAAQLQTAADKLEKREQQLLARLGPRAKLPQRISALQKLQQPAADLAALLR